MAKESASGPGHNTTIVKSKLEALIKRVEKRVEDRKAINEDIREILDEVKLAGFDKKTVKEMIKLRAMESEKRVEQEDLRDMYMSALGLAN